MAGKKMNKTSRKKTIAVLFVALMVGVSIGTIILYAPPLVGNAEGVNPPSPALSSIGETASVSTGVQYYKPVLQSNSTKQTTFLFSKENSTYSNTTYYDPSESWTISSTGYVTSTTFTLPSSWFWGFSDTNTIQLQDLAFMSQYLEDTSGNFGYSVGDIIYVNLTPASGSVGFDSGASFSWSTTSLSSGLKTDSEVVYINPSWNIYAAVSGLQAYGPMDVTISLVYSGAFKWSGSQDGVVTSNSQTGNVYSTQTTLPVATNVPYAIGYNYPPTTVTLSFPSTMTSAQIVTENPQLPMYVTYNGITETVPYTFTASFSVDTLKFSFLSTNTIDPAISVQYYLGSLYEAQSTSTTETASPSYTYTQVSGAINQASASFSFTASIPSNDVFADYAGSLITTFSPSVTVTNPYYSYAQNYLAYHGSGSSTVSGSSSNTQNPSFSFASYSETSSNTPSWSVSMYLYGNVAPSLVSQNVVWAGTSDTAILYFNVTQPEFSGEPIGETINWGDGNITTVSPTTTYNIVERHTYSSTGTYEISVVYSNSPDPVTLYNGLSSLSATSPSLPYVISISPTATPAPYSTLEQGQGISISFSTTHDIVNAVTLTINGGSVAFYPMNTASGSTPTYYPSSAGQSPITAVWHFDGANYNYSVVYEAPEYPSINSPYITTMYGSTATDQYPITMNSTPNKYFPITINSPPSGTGDYQQLINITDPSQYGINTAYSNFQFVLPNDTLLYAWIEDANSSVVQVWVKMPFSTPIIYLQVLPTSENVLSATGYTGEAPQLSSTYAEYDNGASVFNFYDNFAGTTLSSEWAIVNSPVITVNNGITVGGGDQFYQVAGIYLKTKYSFPGVLEAYSGSTWGYAGFMFTDDINGAPYSNTPWLVGGSSAGYMYNGVVADPFGTASATYHFSFIESADGTYNFVGTGGVGSIITNNIVSIYSSGSEVGQLINYGSTYSRSFSASLPSTTYNIEIAALTDSSISLHWIRYRTYVPEMPTTSIGSGAYSTPPGIGDYQQLINITDPSQYGINTAYSNFQFALPNDTLLYAWIHDANSSVVQVGVRMPIDTSTIYLQVLPSFENVLGEAPRLSVVYGKYDIGSGSAFLANATQFTHDPYSTVASYAQNPLDEIYTYNVYDSFNSNYITLLANASWQFYGSSGYSKWDPGIHALTFYNVSGIGEVSASFIEPSQQIGQPTFISLSLNAYSQSFYNGFAYTGNYTPYGSTTPRSFSGTSSSFELPFGSTANLTILNEWDQPVYSITGLVINQTTMPISIDLDNDITIGTLQFVNTTASQVTISANGVSQAVSGYLPVYLKNNSQYVVSASIYDPSLGHNVNYSVNVITNAPSQTIWINATAPLAELQLYANAYSGSQIGELSSSGSDMVIATINGQPYDLGSTFVSFVGKALHVRIATVLNQTLYNGSILLTQPFMSTTINIQTPSWNFQLKNNEQVYNTSSPLATETVKLTDTATNYIYTTTDMVGQLLSLYLASEPYHIYLHDNLTYSANFTLNNNTYWILFGQQLLTVGEYDAKISQIYSNTAGLSLLPINSPAETYAGQKNVLQFELFYANGTTVTGQQLNEFLANSTLTAGNSTSTIVMTPYVSGNVIYANLTIPNAGSYTVRFTGGFSYGGALLGAHASYPLTVLSTAVNGGLHLYISGPTSVPVNSTATFYLQFQYSNGSLLSASSSTSLLKNITAEIGSSPLTVTELSAGDFSINYMPVSAGSYLLTVSGYFEHSGVNLTTSSFYPFYTSSATNELIPVPVDTPASALPNISMSYVIEAAFPNGTLLTHEQLATLVNNSAYSMENSKTVPLSLYVSGNDLYINFTLPTAGYYTLTLTSYLNTPSTHYSLVYSATITGLEITPASRGLEETISIPGTIMVDNATTGTVIFTLTPNGATPTASQTKELLANTTLELLYNGKYVQVILPLYARPGTAVFTVNESKVGTGYTVLAYTQSTTISGQNVSFTGSSQAFTVSSQNPASPPTPVTAQSIESFLTSPAALLLEFLATIAGIIAWIKPKIRAKHEQEEQDLNQAALGVEAGIALKILGGQPLTASEQAWWAAIPEKTRKDLMREGTAGQRVRFPTFSLRQNKANGVKK